MHSRRFAAAFLACFALFVVPGFLHAEGTAADKMCPAEEKNKQEYQPAKPWNKYFTEKRDGKTVTIMNLFGKPCSDTTAGKTTKGHCLRENRCLADQTAEGEKPQQANCDTINKDDPGCQSGSGSTADPEAPDNGPVEEPKEPKPDNSDGVLPLPEETKPQTPETKPETDIWKDGTTPFYQPTNSFGEVLKETGSDSWFSKAVESYFGPSQGSFGETSNIGNYYGAQSLQGGGSDNGVGGSSGGSLYEQALNNYNTPSSFGESTGQTQQQDTPWYTQAAQWAGQKIGAASDYVASTYNSLYDSVFGGTNEPLATGLGEETAAPAAEQKDYTDPFPTNDETMPQLSDEEVARINDQGIRDREAQADYEEAAAEQARTTEDQRLAEREAQADRETAAYEKALADAEKNIPKPEQVLTDPQREFERANREEETRRIAEELAREKSPLPNAAPVGRTGESLLQEIKEWKDNVLDPTRERIEESEARKAELRDTYDQAIQRANRFRDQNMVGVGKDGYTPQFKSQADVDAYNKLVSNAETARQNYEAERLTNEIYREEYAARQAEVQKLINEYDNLPAETKAFEAIQQQKIDSQVRQYEIANDLDAQRAIRDNPDAPYTERMAAAAKIAGLEKQLSAQEAVQKAMENRESCIYNCTFGKALADAYKPADGPLTPEQQAQRTGLLESAQQWAEAQRRLNNPPDFSTVTNPETGIFEPNPRAAEDLARWQAERQADIDRANTRGEEFAGLRERSAETQGYIDAKTGNQNPLLTAYQTYIDGLKTVAGATLETPVGYLASQFTNDQQLINGFGALGSQMAAPMAPIVGIGAGAGEQLLGAVGEPLPETQLSNLYKADDALAIQRAVDIGATALNAVGFAPESVLAKAGALFSGERLGASIADDLGRAVAAETKLSRMETQLDNMTASYERALQRAEAGGANAPSQAELASMRADIANAENIVSRMRASDGIGEASSVRASDVPTASAIPDEVRALTYGDAAPAAVAETNATRAVVTANDTTEAAAAISRGTEAGALQRVGVAEVNGERFIYEAKGNGEVILSPASGARVGDMPVASAAELNAIADAKGISPVVNEPTVLRDLVGPVTPAERTAVTNYENAAREVDAWKAAPSGPSPVSRLALAERELEGAGLAKSIDGSVYRPTTGEILGRIEEVEPGLINVARPDAELPAYTKAGDSWYETNNLSKPITNPDIIQVLESKLPTNSVPASQVAADMQQSKAIAAAEAKAAERARLQRAAEDRAAREAAEKSAERNLQPPVKEPNLSKPEPKVPRLDNSPEVIADLKRLEKIGDQQALAENGRILSGPTTQSIRDGLAGFKNAGGVPGDVKFAKSYLEDAMYRVSPEGNLTRITDPEIAAAVKNATNPTIRASEAESIGRAAQHTANAREAKEALEAQIRAAQAYEGEIMLAGDLREARRAVSGDVDAIAQQAARDAVSFAWTPEAQLPLTLAEATGGKNLLTEVETALANPFKLPETSFGRAGSGNAASDGLASVREPYRAPQTTFSDAAPTALQERLGRATPPATIAERASLTEGARPVPSPRTAVQDLAPAIDNIPLVEVKPTSGVRAGDPLTLPEAQAVRSFNSALANYSKNLEAGADLARPATQLSNAYAELAEVGIRQRTSDGALARESGEVVAVRVSPPMAAQAAYAVVVPVDSQVREFATGQTDETFSFTTPDLRVLSSDFGVQPPINTDEAITLQKVNDILDSTRSRDSFDYAMDDSGLRVRPEDGFIVREANGEVIARPQGGSGLPGALPDRYVPAGPVPPLPIKLARADALRQTDGKIKETYEATDYRGKKVAGIEVVIDGAIAKVTRITSDRPGQTDWSTYTNSLGSASVRSLLNQFKEHHPEIVAIAGPGAQHIRVAGEWDPSDIGEPMEMLLPTLASEPVPVRASGNGPAAIALGLALSVASPLPISAITDAIGGPNNAFSIAAQAAQQPTARDIERHAKAIADIGKIQRGIASWYGTGSNGGTNPSDLTASGAWHTNNDYTVAMLGAGPKYAWGTRLSIKNVQEFLKDGSPNPAFGKEVEVIVTSTGGQPNRSLDLSPAARDAIGIGADGTALVEFSVVSVPDIIDAMYRKGRTDLTGGSPVPKGTFNQKVASLKENPKLALAEPRLKGTTLVAGSKGTNPIASALDSIGKSIGDVLKASKTSSDKAVDLVTTIQKANPNISSLELAARLELSGYKNTDTYQSMRERAAHELIGKQGSEGGVTDTQLANADVKIAQRVQAIKNPPPAPKLSIAEAAKLSGQPQIKGIDKMVYLAPLSDPAKANKRSYIVLHQTEGPTALSLAKKQAANPNRVGTTLWVEPDGTVYWSAPETANPSHVRANRDDNKFIPNKDTLNKITNANAIGIEFAGNYPDPAKPLTDAQMRVGKVLISFLQERYNIPAQNIFAHGWIDYKHEGYVEGGQLATAARELAYVPRAGSPLAVADAPAPATTPEATDPWAFSTTGDTPAMPAPESRIVSADTAPEFTKPASTRSLSAAPIPEAPAVIAPDLAAQIAINVEYAPLERSSWKLPTPNVTLAVTTPLEPIPVPTVARGEDLAPAVEPTPTQEQIAAIPVPDQAPVNFNDVRQPTTPLAANPVPNVVIGPELEQPIPREVIKAAKLDPIKSDEYNVVLAQPTMVRQALFGNFGTFSYIPPSLREKLANAEHDDDFIVFTRAELNSIRWDKMDKNGYQVMAAVLSGGGAYTPPVPNSNRDAGPQIFADGLETINTVVIVKPEAPGAEPDEVFKTEPFVATAVPEKPVTIEELAVPAEAVPADVPQKPAAQASPTTDIPALEKRVSDAQAAADTATKQMNDAKQRFDANTAKLKTIAENNLAVAQTQANLDATQSGLNMLRSLNALPNENQLAQLKASVASAKRLSANVAELEDPALADTINKFASLLNSLRIKENQTAGNRNATVNRGNSITTQTRSLIAETVKETKALGTEVSIKSENTKLAAEFARLKKEIAAATAERDAAQLALTEAKARPQPTTDTPVNTTTVAEAPATTAEVPLSSAGEPLPASRPAAEQVTVTTAANPADQTRVQKAFNRTVDAIAHLNGKLLTDTAVKSYKKLAQAVGLGPKESSTIPVLKSAPFDATPVPGSDLSYVCSTGSTCSEKTSDAVIVRTEPGRSYARVVADDKPIVAKGGEAALNTDEVKFLARAAGGFVTAGSSGKPTSQDLTYNKGKLIGSKTVNPNASQGLVVANEKGDVIIVDKRDIPVSEFSKLGADIGRLAPTDRIDVAKDVAKLDAIMRDNRLSAFTNLLLIKDGAIQNVQSSIAEPRRLLLQMPDGSIAILNSTKDQTMLGITQIAKALGATYAVNLDTGSYNEGRVAVQSGEAPYLGNTAKSDALTNIYLGVRATPQPVPTVVPGERTESPIAGETLPAGQPSPVPNTPAPNNAPIESFGVTGRRTQPDFESPQTTPANDNTPPAHKPVPTAPIRTADVIAFTQPKVAPLLFTLPTEQWPTVTPAPQLILEGEILPPAPVATSRSQVGESAPVLDLTPIRHIYGGTDALGAPQVVLDTVVTADTALIALRPVGPAAPTVEEVESLLRQFAARYPQVQEMTPISLPTTEERGLSVIRPTVNVLPALENILVTGPTLYVNSAGNVWPTLSGASADADLRRMLTAAQADTSIEDAIRDLVATIKPGESLAEAAASKPSVPTVTPPRLADRVLSDAVREFASDRRTQPVVRTDATQQIFARNDAQLDSAVSGRRNNAYQYPPAYQRTTGPVAELTGVLSNSGITGPVFEGSVNGRSVAVKVFTVENIASMSHADWLRQLSQFDGEIQNARAMQTAIPDMTPALVGPVNVGGTPSYAMETVRGKDAYKLTVREANDLLSDATVRTVADGIKRLADAGLGGADSPQVMILTHDQTLNGVAHKKGDAVFIDAGDLSSDVSRWRSPEEFAGDIEYIRQLARAGAGTRDNEIAIGVIQSREAKQLLDDAVTRAVRDILATNAPQVQPSRPSVPQQPKPDLAGSSAPSRSFGQIASDVWSDTKLAARISRGVVFPASTVKRNIAVNSLNMMGAYVLTGPYTVITWPMANVGWRYVFNKDYRADVNSVFSRVATAIQNARAERAVARANQEALNPNMAPSGGTQSVPNVSPTRAPDVSLEDGIRELVTDINAGGPTPEQIIDEGIAEITSTVTREVPAIRSFEMPSASPIRSFTTVPLNRIDDLVAPKTAGTMRLYRGIGQAYDPLYTGPDPYFTPDYVDALNYAMTRAVPGAQPELIIAEVNIDAMKDLYAYRQIQGVLQERMVGFGELTSSYLQIPKNWFDTAMFDPKFPHDIAGLDAKIKTAESALPDWVTLLNQINDRRIAIAVQYIKESPTHWAELSTAQQDAILNADAEYVSLRKQFQDLGSARDQIVKQVAEEFRAQHPLPTDPVSEGVPPITNADRLTETVGEFAADRPEIEKWGPFSNIRNWFTNLGRGGSGGGNGGGNGNGSGGDALGPAGNTESNGSIIRGIASLLRLIPGLSNLIANGPQPEEKKTPGVDVPVGEPLPAGKPDPSKTETKPTESKPTDAKPAETKTDPKKDSTVPGTKPETKPATTQPKPQPDAKPAPQTPPPGPTPTGKSAPTGGTNASGGGSMNGLMSFLSGLMRGLTGSPQPKQQPLPSTLPNGGVVVAIYAQPNPASPTEQVLVRWTSTNATTCSVFNASSTKVATGVPGAMFNVIATDSNRYTAYCSNTLGQYASATVQIVLK